MIYQKSGKSPRKHAVPAQRTAEGVTPTNGDSSSVKPARPRRFSLLYSSDSSLSDMSDRQSHSDISEEGEDDDDDDDDDDTSSSSDDDDENIDFVKLSAQRKKKAMQALSLFKNKHQLNNDSQAIEEEDIGEEVDEKITTGNRPDKATKAAQIDEDLPVPQFKSDNEEDNELDKNIENDSDSVGSSKLANNSGLEEDSDQGGAISSEEESDYDIDQDAYFNAIEKEDDLDSDAETGNDDEDLPMILHEEEQNIVKELGSDDNLSGWEAESTLSNFDIYSGFDNDDEEENEDENDSKKLSTTSQKDSTNDDIMNELKDFKIPNLNTAKPFSHKKGVTSDMSKFSIKKKRGDKTTPSKHDTLPKASSIDSDDYIFNVFFQSDDSETENNSSKKSAKSADDPLKLSDFFKTNADKAKSMSNSSHNLLHDEAHLPSDDDSYLSNGTLDKGLEESPDEDNFSDLEGISISSIDFDEDDDDISINNVFVDIDDLDPDSFYFKYDDDEESSGSVDVENISLYLSEGKNGGHDVIETTVYVHDDSTDEDDNLPPPEARNKTIGTKAKEIVSANVVGLKPPKLGTWNTENKPFSIIDGLSTKSLHSLIQEHQQMKEQKLNDITLTKSDFSGTSSPGGDELTLNELLNMSELDDDEDKSVVSHGIPSNMNNAHLNKGNIYNSLSVTDWYEKPKVPLSAFRNKGISSFQEEDYMANATQIKKVPIGYMGMEKTRRKFDKMKELQKKRQEKKRRLRKKKKLLKLKKEQARQLQESEIERQLSLPPVHLAQDQDLKLSI
ncbi:uncharacterized protein GVI51_C00583 [Nakaseomyces glabratus]|uniref:Protein IFH1 n=2 Tax=Candida glabrata TaxID=5478 RepID=Q6FX29_CANGA|nr:uncharacterized protein CAGL0C00759g [Nakaseomyces glabratus]KAH7609004.1 Transcription factor CRF1 [Nakaseomyces glabratus]KAH7609870.1 Transcription factor CRF1 [Nakaseomyces glabratus]KTA98783.1 Protein IFH1 [Nakaseomyces glabratus]KTA98922.1 Protein IFH1 [Nakaseomyces glabratus]KTB13762.1 Protein IFH1 [Nakaseomyces glabratus]|eukprot:XP_445215.1 uncharacterized protein CAGL0C00759g [[Candida] glabrata]